MKFKRILPHTKKKFSFCLMQNKSLKKNLNLTVKIDYSITEDLIDISFQFILPLEKLTTPLETKRKEGSHPFQRFKTEEKYRFKD